MKYNIIGDIHGRESWKQLVVEDAVNIFLGDYTDPYQYEGTRRTESVAANLKEIIRYKDDHPETVLLLGNHDLHYIWGEHYSRYNGRAAMTYRQILKDNWDKFSLAYSIENEILITHAGVTREWLKLAGHPELKEPQEIADMINALKNDPKLMKTLSVEMTFEPWDCYGESATASPIWVRPETLAAHNALEKGRQVVGHTQMPEPIATDEICFVDCLGSSVSSLIIIAEDGTYVYGVHDAKQQEG